MAKATKPKTSRPAAAKRAATKPAAKPAAKRTTAKPKAAPKTAAATRASAKASAKPAARKTTRKAPQKAVRKSGTTIRTSRASAKTRAQTYAAADPAFAAGLDVRHAMWGSGGGEDQINAASDFMLPMQEVVTKYCFGETWTREALPHRERSMVTLGILVAQGRPHELKVHVRGALANGVTKEEIGEILRHAMVYSGIPRGVEAFRCAAEVLQELGLD